MARIVENLADRLWKRTVNKGGKVKFWGKEIYLGKRFNKSTIFISLDPTNNLWFLRTDQGHTLKTLKNFAFSENDIFSHAGISKN